MRARVDEDFAGDHGLFVTTRAPGQRGDAQTNNQAD
jgi:hypothetical protein